MRSKKIIYGNWKMNQGPRETEAFFNELSPEFKDFSCIKGIAPQAPLLNYIKKEGMPHHILAGAQNCSTQESGAMTGETSAKTLAEMRTDFVLVGHSERREIFCETDEIINQKLKMVLSCGIQAVFCLGETLEQREADQTFDVLKAQVQKGLAQANEYLTKYKDSSLVVAYEPVWAIGTGKVASADQAQEAHAFIRKEIKSLGIDADQTPILYGGSVKPNNVKELLEKPDIDGALVGGASLKVSDYIELCRIAQSV